VTEPSLPTGRLLKRHSQFYYVEFEGVVFECMGRANLKKAGLEPTVGDFVTLDSIDEQSKTGRIASILPRKNALGRPSVTNADGVFVVCAFREPSFDFTQTDRYLTHVSLNGMDPVLCITKIDLADNAADLEAIQTLYEKLGIPVEFLSIKRDGVPDSLKQRMKDKMHVLAGPSGSGKSSLLNALNNQLHLRIGDVSDKNARGRHTTRHASLLQIDENDPHTLVADTPGFSNLRFDQCLPADIVSVFPEFRDYKADCAFSDCFHLTETDCAVRNNENCIAPSRYASYQVLIQEAKEFEALLKKSSSKVERGYKRLDGEGSKSIEIVRLKEKNRDPGRKTLKQQVDLLILDEKENEENLID